MKARLKDFPVDHRLMAVADTPKMAALAQQIAALQAEYDKLRDDEQRRQFAAFLRTVRGRLRIRKIKHAKGWRVRLRS